MENNEQSHAQIESDNTLDFGALTIRMATSDDFVSFMRLWRICFKDADTFVDWFFDNRFLPEYSVCIEKDGEIICAMQSMPLPIYIREISFPGAIVAGVCTMPEYRGHHLMKRMFTFYLEKMREKGIIAITYRPENFNTYHSLGHFASSRTIHFDMKIKKAVKSANAVGFCRSKLYNNKFDYKLCPIDLLTKSDLLRCYDLYTSVSTLYSGMVKRDFDLFKFKSEDYACVGGEALLLFHNSDLTGYCFFFDMKSKIYGEELISWDLQSTSEIINIFSQIFTSRNLFMKIPSIFTEFLSQNQQKSLLSNEIMVNEIRFTLDPQNVLGITKIEPFIQTLNLKRFANASLLSEIIIEIDDPVLTENSVIINLLGKKTAGNPCIKIAIGSLMQILCGYTDLVSIIENEIKMSPNDTTVMVFDESKILKINEFLRPVNCFVVDEY